MPHLVYVSDLAPAPGRGGGIIADRHLRHLAANGWDITLVMPEDEAAASGPWREIKMPSRRAWWPPFRPEQPWLANWRAWAWRRELHRAGLAAPDAVLTVCKGPLSWLAASLARAWQRPLITIVHDWWGETDDRIAMLVGRRACAGAKKILAVSAEMQAALTAENGRPVDVLYPVPAAQSRTPAEWQDTYRTPAVAHAGALHAFHENFLARLAEQLATCGGHLLLLCPRDNAVAVRLQKRCPNLVHQDFLASNAEALDWLARNASALVVMYEHGYFAPGQPVTGFPSRFVEFSQLGLPILLAAPMGNPVRSWADRQAWRSQVEPNDSPALARWVRELAQPETWQAFAEDTRHAARTDFDPVRLQAQFTAALTP